jgi:hypothetical protein
MNLLVKIRLPILYLFTAFLIFSFFVPTIHAQTEALNINVLPKYPGPFERVSISIEDFSRDLNKVDVSWTVDGKPLQHGVGLKRIQLNTGALGTATNVSINMGGLVRQITLRPTIVDLLWQADTYTPPFYKGKALHSNQDPVLVEAEPFFVDSKGTRSNPANLIYRWKEDGQVNAALSGFGKKTFRITPSIIPKPINVEVEVMSSDDTYHSIASINIPNSSPEVVFYENKPLYVIDFTRSFNDGDFNIAGSESKVVATPYFFSNEQKDLGQLSSSWRLNNAPINEPGNEVILRKPENGGGVRSLISLNIKNLERFMQTADGSFYATFDKPTETQNNPGLF